MMGNGTEPQGGQGNDYSPQLGHKGMVGLVGWSARGGKKGWSRGEDDQKGTLLVRSSQDILKGNIGQRNIT